MLVEVINYFGIEVKPLTPYSNLYTRALENDSRILRECPPKPKLQSAIRKGLLMLREAILVKTFEAITGKCLMICVILNNCVV